MRLVTWNVAGRVRRHAEQAAALAELQADVVALQEVTATTHAAWRDALAAAGLPHAASPLEDGPPPKPRRLAVLTAAREPLERVAGPGDLPWPERVLVAALASGTRIVSHGRLRPERGERWVAAERSLVAGLLEHGYVDAFRALHGYADRSASWTYPRGRGGYRLDHVLVRGLRPVAAAYEHAWREQGLSDHSALVVELEAEGPPATVGA